MKTGSIKKEKPALSPFLQERDDAICVSVIVPLNPLSPGRNGDPLRVEKAIARAKEALQRNVPEKEASRLQQDLVALYSSINFNQAAQGIGLFVSASVKQVVLFFFLLSRRRFPFRTYLPCRTCSTSSFMESLTGCSC